MYLTLRRKRFIEAYTGQCFGNGTESAIKAGYSPKSARSTASFLLTVPNIKRLIEERLQQLTLTAEDIEHLLADLLNECKRPSDKARVLELLGKAKGLFKDQTSPQVALFQGVVPQAIVNNRVKDTNKLT